MNNIEAKAKINNKLKLYKTSLIGSISTSLMAGFVSGGGVLLVSPNPSSLLTIFAGLGVQTAITCAGISALLPDYNYKKIEALKNLKSELKQGKNPFKNIDEQEFNSLLEIRTKDNNPKSKIR